MQQVTFATAIKWMTDHPYVYAIGIMVVALIAAKVMDRLFSRVFLAYAKKTKTSMDNEFFEQIHRPLQITIIILGALFAFVVVIEDEDYQGYAFSLIMSCLICLWTWVVVRGFRFFFDTVMQRKKDDSSIVQALPLLNNLIMVILLVHCAYWIMHLWEINVTPLLASAGIVTAAVALASKDTLANFFGGVSVFVDRPYKISDYIILESGERGQVVNIGVRSTRVLTRDDVLITVPNAVMATSKIVNQSGHVNRFRLRCKIGVAYGSDLDQVEKELLGACQGLKEVMVYPAPRARFRNFGDSALEYELMCWIKNPADRGRIQHLLNKQVYQRLNQAGVEIPFPQRVVSLARKGMEESCGFTQEIKKSESSTNS